MVIMFSVTDGTNFYRMSALKIAKLSFLIVLGTLAI